MAEQCAWRVEKVWVMGRVMNIAGWASYGCVRRGGRGSPSNHRSLAMTFAGPCSLQGNVKREVEGESSMNGVEAERRGRAGRDDGVRPGDSLTS